MHVTPQYHFPAQRGAIIVTPEGQAYFPASLRMTPEEYLDWLASLNVTLSPMPSRRRIGRAA